MIREENKQYVITAAVAIGIVLAIFALVFITGPKEEASDLLADEPEVTEIATENLPPGDPMVVGNGPTTVEIFTDPSCDGCSKLAFEHGQEITNAVADGEVTVKYHLLDIGVGEGDYSERANAAIRCSESADPEQAARMAGMILGMKHNGSPDLSDQDFVGISQGVVGLPESSEQCILNGDMIETAAIASDKGRDRLAATGSPGVPTVLVDGVLVDVSDSDWLSNALA